MRARANSVATMACALCLAAALAGCATGTQPPLENNDAVTLDAPMAPDTGEASAEAEGIQATSDAGDEAREASDKPLAQEAPDSPANAEAASSGDSALIAAGELSDLLAAGEASVIDVRTLGDYYMGHIANSANIPAGRQIEIRLREVPQKGLVVLAGTDTDQAKDARDQLLENGIEPDRVRVLDGGIDAWVSAGMELEMILEKGC